jgi:coenzyme F420-0:L-glutamate ligase/coenzyme F420-1:gamma-L-glutamate ligase
MPAAPTATSVRPSRQVRPNVSLTTTATSTPSSSARRPRSTRAEAFRIASAALPEFPVVLRYGGEDDGVVDVHLTDAVSTTTAINLGAQLGAAIVQLHAEGWATRWEPVGTPGGTSLVGRLWLGTPPS